jgi:crotonobetainyl-CoA:carnitine CoA-transferase CaiB-like acyl-CoA transferase
VVTVSAPLGQGPLAGLVVLDLTRLLPGGYCTLLLSDLGAGVIKVEEPGRGDYIRWTPPLVDGESAAHRALNRGKRSITLNLKDPAGVSVLRRLAAGADVLVESFRPGVMDRLGIGHAAISEENPGLVYCAITGYGQDGPYRDRVGHDINYLGFGGALSMTGPTGGPPVVPGVQVGDLGGGGMLGAIGILSALVERTATGRGRFVDASMLDGIVSWLSIHAGQALATGQSPRPGEAALNGAYACYRVYATSDGRHVTVGALEPRFWRVLCGTLGLPELVDRQFGPPSDQAWMAERLQEAFAGRTRDEWVEIFRDVPACVGPVKDVLEALADPQVVHRGMVASVDGVPVGPGPAIKLSGFEPGRLAPAPGLGEHTAEVLASIGIRDDELADLRSRGAI